jgi:DNA (cytosine-5)-methyltransferase 1
LTAYYNENDPKAAAWLRDLILRGHIAEGEVDERSIEDVTANDLVGFTQCHFFAGIGGWSYALRLAGWSDDRPVWTGSCPCQPFSAAGKGDGFADERHLWPAWFHLIRTVRPQQVFGEQVASALPWLDLVQTDLEAEGYASGAAIVGAHSVGAPHIRQRLYWVAESESQQQQHGSGDSWRGRREPSNGGELGNPDDERLEGRSERRDRADQRSAWASELVDCRDGKRRPVEPGTFPLAHGVPHRVGLLRGYGNAIVPQVAAAFIEAYLTA